MSQQKMKNGAAWPRRFWLRACRVAQVLCANDDRAPTSEFYVYWWFWSLELVRRGVLDCSLLGHRAVSESVLEKDEVIDRTMADALRTARRLDGLCDCHSRKIHEPR